MCIYEGESPEAIRAHAAAVRDARRRDHPGRSTPSSCAPTRSRRPRDAGARHPRRAGGDRSLSRAASASAAAGDGLAAARAGTAKFHSNAAAQAAGYGLLVDAAGIACIDNPAGGMGIHYVNGALVGDGKVNAATPELVVYEPAANGRLRLVAAEYVVFQAAWDAKHTSAPELFGQEFELVEAGNRYGLPPFYELHAWLWKHNPAGMFDDWNPRVSCAARLTSGLRRPQPAQAGW